MSKNKILIIEKVENTCEKCGYKWMTRSKLLYVTCPSCRRTVRNNYVLKKMKEGVPLWKIYLEKGELK